MTLKKLESIISVSITEPLYGKTGWEFGTALGGTLDAVNGKATLAEIYLLADPHYTGRVSVPVLWDKKRRTIVNNESSEIIRMLNSAFDAFTDVHADYYPAELRGEIDAATSLFIPTSIMAFIAPVLRPASRPTKRPPMAFSRLSTKSRNAWRANAIWSGVNLPKRIGAYSRRWCDSTRSITAISNAICGASPTILICGITRAISIRWPRIAETVSIDHIKRHYYGSQRQVNPTGIVPIGPTIDFAAPHDRNRFG